MELVDLLHHNRYYGLISAIKLKISYGNVLLSFCPHLQMLV